jgi:hypothetical protein
MNDKNPKRIAAGHARAASLTPERRSDIAKKAADTRWRRSYHRGNFLQEFGVDIDCYVLDDGQRTAMVSKRGMGAALGFDLSGGTRLQRFLASENLAKFGGLELGSKLENPVVFHYVDPGSNGNPQPLEVHGYDVTILIDICRAVIEASAAGTLGRRHAHIVRRAQVIVNASAKVGIRSLVYALAGYDATKEAVIEAFKAYVREEAKEWCREFPEELYEEWYRLYKIPRPEKNRPWKFMYLTLDHVYHPLARSRGTILHLTRQQRLSSGDASAKLHQFLSEVGSKVLRVHLGRILGIAQVSESRENYERNIQKVFGGQVAFDFGN